MRDRSGRLTKQLFAIVIPVLLVLSACTGSGDSDADQTDQTNQAGTTQSPNDGDLGDDDSSDDVSADGDTMPGDGVTVTAGRANWSIGYLQSAIFAALLTELGYTVTDPALNELPPGNGYVAMADGSIDFWPSSVYPAHFQWHESQLTDGSSVGDHLVVLGELLPSAALEGLLVTKSVADEFGIESLEQINNDQELVAVFDGDGNGKADIFGCPEEWTCDDILDATIERNGWTNLEQIKLPYDGAVADAVGRVEAGEAVIQYGWSPSAALAQLEPGENVLWLSLGAEGMVCDGIDPCLESWDFQEAASGVLDGTCTQSTCVTGWEVADIVVTANADFVAANPVAGVLFDLVEINLADVVNFGVRFNTGESTEDDIRAIADEWIEDNRPLVDEWLIEAAAAG